MQGIRTSPISSSTQEPHNTLFLLSVGYYLGNHIDFAAYVHHYYNLGITFTQEHYESVAQENASTHSKFITKAHRAASDAPKPLNVVITSAASSIASHLIYRIANGDVFGDSDIRLCLLDSRDKVGELEGIAMETVDCACALIKDIQVFSSSSDAFKDARAVFIIDDTLASLSDKTDLFKEFGKALELGADRDVKVVVSGIHSLPLMSLLSTNAPSLSTDNFSAVSRLLEMQAKSQIAQKLGVNTSDVKDVIIWGGNCPLTNDSNVRTIIDVKRARVHNHVGAICGPPFYSCSAVEALRDSKWVDIEFNDIVLKESKEIGRMRNAMPVMSTSAAIAEHMRDWWAGRKSRDNFDDQDIVSAGLISKGWFSTPYGVACSFPVRVGGGEDGERFVVAEDVEMTEEMKKQFSDIVEQLVQNQDCWE